MPTPGPMELIIILIVLLLLVGPGKLPDVGAALGKGIRDFRRATNDDPPRPDDGGTPSRDRS